MAATSKAARAAALNDAYTSPFALSGADVSGPQNIFGRGHTAFFRDGVGDRVRTGGVDTVTNPLLLDTVGGDSAGTAQTISVGATTYAVIEDLNDRDFFSVTLEAGKTYAISQLLHLGGTATGDGTLLSGVPLADAFFRLYGADGVTLLAEVDGGSNTTPSGLDAKLVFTATASGTYYIDAGSFDQDATNGTGGDHVGDYTLQVQEVPASEAPLPRFYSAGGQAPNELLDSIDWGSTWDHTVRNPDGDNGTRTNNGVANGGTPITNTEYGIVGKNVMKVYFAKQGDVFLSDDPLNPGLETTVQAREMLQWEKDAFRATMDLYEQVTDLQYIEVDNRADADIKIIIYPGTPGAGASLLGRMSPPGEQNEGQMEINAGDYRWTEEGVSPGGFFFPTLLHEFGHGHGMKHPHDTGGGGPVMHGAEPSEDPVEGAIGGQYGDFGLSQQIFTVMSYNDGWNETGGVGGRPVGHGGPSSGGLEMQADHFGWMGTLAAIDIAILQDKYGVNEEWATGDDVYTIEDTNEAGHYYRTIWDGGGSDEIRYVGSRNANIDLRAATLRYEEGGGGRVSFAMGAWTGFTIANGVTIERATGGDGDDILTGNDADNILTGGLGADTLNGGGGLDTADYSTAAAGVSVRLGINRTLNDGSGSVDTLSSIENVTGSDFNDSLFGDGAANVLSGGLGRDVLIGFAGNDTLRGGSGVANELYGGLGDDRFIIESAGDTIIENAGEGNDTVETALASYVLSAANVENLVLTAAGGATGTGNASANLLTGGAGDDVLIGKGGADTLNGGGGRDTADYSAAAGAVAVKLALGQASNDGDGASDVLVSIENVTGSAFDDVLIGDGVANVLIGGAGRDTLLGLAGDDLLIGGSGVANQMQGGAGNDRYIVQAVGDTLVENVGEGTDTVETTLGGFTLRANIENLIYTGAGNFAGIGNASANVITGGNGADTLTGAGGDDVLNGGAGNDLALLSGVRGDYSVVAGGAPGQYQITDSVGGRDGVDQLNGIERVRFSDGSTFLLSDLVAPAAAPALSAKGMGDAQVLPSVIEDDFLIGKGDDMPWVMPGADTEMYRDAMPSLSGFDDPGTMLTLFQDDGHLLAAPEFNGRDHDSHHDWM